MNKISYYYIHVLCILSENFILYQLNIFYKLYKKSKCRTIRNIIMESITILENTICLFV